MRSLLVRAVIGVVAFAVALWVWAVAGPGIISTLGADTVVSAGQATYPSGGLRILNHGGTGCPSSGAHVAGELAVGTDGALCTCTVAGSPGTWVQVGASGSGLPPRFLGFEPDQKISSATQTTIINMALQVEEEATAGYDTVNWRALLYSTGTTGDDQDCRIYFDIFGTEGRATTDTSAYYQVDVEEIYSSTNDFYYRSGTFALSALDDGMGDTSERFVIALYHFGSSGNCYAQAFSIWLSDES